VGEVLCEWADLFDFASQDDVSGWDCDGEDYPQEGACTNHWDGILCDTFGVVVGIDLSGFGLSGKIPTNLMKLTAMRTLKLDGNSFTGTIPCEIAQMTQVTSISLRNNQITGSIPSCLSAMTQLSAIDFSDNSLNGTIPEFLGGNSASSRRALTAIETAADVTDMRRMLPALVLSNAITIDLSSNRLTGQLPLDMSGFTKLESLNLAANDLTGDIPSSLLDLTRLASLDIGHNRFAGPLPAFLGDWVSLVSIRMNACGLTGSIPSVLHQLSVLQLLDVSDNSLAGSLPNELIGLEYLRELYIHNNKLAETLPNGLGSMKRLRVLSAHENMLSGEIPATVTLLTNMQTMSLYYNSLTSTIPAAVGSMAKLVHLSLGYNHFSGTLPDSLRALHKLKTMDLQGNAFSGPVSSAISEMSALTTVELNDNALTGSVPSSIVQLSNIFCSTGALRVDNNYMVGGRPSSVDACPQNMVYQPQMTRYPTSMPSPTPPEEPTPSIWTAGLVVGVIFAILGFLILLLALFYLFLFCQKRQKEKKVAIDSEKYTDVENAAHYEGSLKNKPDSIKSNLAVDVEEQKEGGDDNSVLMEAASPNHTVLSQEVYKKWTKVVATFIADEERRAQERHAVFKGCPQQAIVDGCATYKNAMNLDEITDPQEAAYNQKVLSFVIRSMIERDGSIIVNGFGGAGERPSQKGDRLLVLHTALHFRKEFFGESISEIDTSAPAESAAAAAPLSGGAGPFSPAYISPSKNASERRLLALKAHRKNNAHSGEVSKTLLDKYLRPGELEVAGGSGGDGGGGEQPNKQIPNGVMGHNTLPHLSPMAGRAGRHGTAAAASPLNANTSDGSGKVHPM
jgi:Leucine-rich repeat (LRR) protein